MNFFAAAGCGARPSARIGRAAQAIIAISAAVCHIARLVKTDVDVMSHTALGMCVDRMALGDGSARTGVL
jgi:hypothetical protein